MEKKITNLESELSNRQTTNREAEQAAKRTERLYKHLVLQAEEEKRNNQHLQKQVDRLQHQMKVIRRQVEEAEEIAAINLNKFRAASAKLQEAEERTFLAESELATLRKSQLE